MTRSNLDCREDQVDTWDSLPSAANNSGRVISVTGIAAYPIKFVSNGTEWVPEGGQATLALSGIGYGIMPSGTMGTGASGHFVSGTALPHTYSAGLWMYFAATAAITPALTAGFYWCVFSNTTTCTIYQSGPGSSAYNFTVGAATTGSTSEVTARTTTIPANLMGAQGQLFSEHSTSIPANTNAKTIRIRFGGSQASSGAVSGAASLSYNSRGVIQNTSASIQITSGSLTPGATTSPNQRLTIDTTAAADVTFTMQMAVATDYIINHSFRLDLFKE